MESLSGETQKKIIELFNEGYSFSQIRGEVFNQCGCSKCRSVNPNYFKFKEFLKIIGKTDIEYRKMLNINLIKKRNEKGENENCWSVIKRKCLGRDNFKCQKCNKKAEEIHHIKEWREERKNELNNLISLCKSCHKKIHKGVFKENKKKVGRNELCPCGSGKKYKNCCLEI
jgi:hypothetical protein